ncbi:hypothetical protein LOCC1_G005337, partial [Lachnellula occidentalis]
SYIGLSNLVDLRAMESDKNRILRIVRDTELAHPGIYLVEAFLTDAVDGDQAAKYLLQGYADNGIDVNFHQFVNDWKELVRLFLVENSHSRILSWFLKRKVARRDDFRCCLTRVPCRFWDVFPIIPPTAFCIREQRLYDMLGAFTTPFHQDLLKDQNLKNQPRNHLTLSKDAELVFSSGLIKFENLGRAKYEILYNNIGGKSPAIYTAQRIFDWRCDLADHSKSGIDSPDPGLLEIHSRLSCALKWTDIATKIDSRSCVRQSQRKESNPFTQTITTGLFAVWSKFPDFIRFQTYRFLRTAGSYFYGRTIPGVQRLPFGMYLKYGPENHAARHAGEFNALKLVRSQTSVPVPRPIDLLLSRTESFLVTSRIEGGPAGLAIDECSSEEMHLMAEDLRSWIAQLRSMKRDRDSEYAITNATGGPCLDYRISADPVGPFRSEEEFVESLRLGILPDLVHRTGYQIVFTHSDLNMRNILVKNGRITGIVDWENAGWFPEYWEYTKCHFAVTIQKRWLKMIDGVFENKYGTEEKIERQYWAYHSAW